MLGQPEDCWQCNKMVINALTSRNYAFAAESTAARTGVQLFLMGPHHPQKVLTFKPTLFGNKEVFHKSPSSGKAKMCACGRSYVENHLSLSSGRISMGMRCRWGLTQYLTRQHSLLKHRVKGTAAQPPRKPVLRLNKHVWETAHHLNR